ncbi:MAG: DUF2953 domain-containing protein [Yoonia sp.]|uniref:DUF2953 domain-containing protein n=1 Tax=Yoonia sp. TaxID=2212373 RepID=UPI003EF14B88
MLLWLGLALLAVAALLVLLPVYLALSWHSDPAKPSTVRLRVFGGLAPAIKVYDSTAKSTKQKPAQKPRKRQRKPFGRRWKPHGDILAEALSMIGKLRDAVRFDALHLNAEIGLGDPAETGQLYGQLCPLIYTTGGRVTVLPNFETSCLRGSALARLHFTLLGLIWPFVRFGWRLFGPGK